MTEPVGVVLAREDGLIDVPDATPVVPGLLETIERLFGALGIPTRDERERPAEQHAEPREYRPETGAH